jgi:ferredoxin
MTRYRITVDRDACDGIFACLVRDERFREAEDGLATLAPGDATAWTETEGAIVAEFEDGQVETAEQAAAACPPDAISVERLEGSQ